MSNAGCCMGQTTSERQTIEMRGDVVEAEHLVVREEPDNLESSPLE